MGKVKKFLLSLVLLFSAIHINMVLPMENTSHGTSAARGTFSKWKKKATWIITSLIIQLTLKEVLIPLIKKMYGNDFTERAKIRSLIKINQALKQQLDYIKKNCSDKNLIKEMETKYLTSCIRVMELQKQYLEKYEKT